MSDASAADREINPNRPAMDLPAALPPDELDRLTEDLIVAMKTVFDPEIPVDVYELGLIYRVDVDDSRFVTIDMTLTAPGCPVAGEMPTWVENAVTAVPGVSGAKVNMVFEPPWNQTRMSEEAKIALTCGELFRMGRKIPI